jgi:guanylate kinase
MTRRSTQPLLVIIGPSGAGKSTIARHLAEDGIARILPTWTTRPRRDSEQAFCPEHRFVSDAAFEALDGAGFFEITGRLVDLPYRYGLPAISPVEPGIATVIARADYVPALARIGTPLVYQLTAPGPVLSTRLAPRGNPTDAATRLASAAHETERGRALSHRSFRTDTSFECVLAQVRAALDTDLNGAAA